MRKAPMGWMSNLCYWPEHYSVVALYWFYRKLINKYLESEADGCLDIGLFNADAFDEMVHRYLPDFSELSNNDLLSVLRPTTKRLFYDIDNYGLSEKKAGLLRETIMNILETFTDRERSVILLRFGFIKTEKESYYLRHCSVNEIGRQLNLSSYDVQKILRRSLRKMRHPTRIRQIINSF
jgi:DNA-binding CsgD family transcriptional regulator